MSEFKLEVGQVFNHLGFTFEVVKIDKKKDEVYSKTDFAKWNHVDGFAVNSIKVFNLCIAENGKNLIK